MELLFHELGISGYTLIAQIVNFLILLLILRKFLYKPLIKLIDKRRNIIEEGLKNADRAKNELEKLHQIKEEKLNEAEKRGMEIVNESKNIAVEKSVDILREAEKKSEELIKESRQIIEEQKRESFLRLKEEISGLAILTAEKILQKSIDAKENEEIIKRQLGSV